MMWEKILRPKFLAKKVKEDPNKFKSMGFHVIEVVGEGYELESLVEYFIYSTFGKYVYIVEHEGRKFLARGDKKIGEIEYLVKDEKGLMRLILKEVKKSTKAALVGITLGFAMAVGGLVGMWKPEFSFIGVMLGGVLGSAIMKIFEYYIIGYCKT
ncbi:hypothetical protein P8X24_02680 [Pyrococcus kukulkanii]|uniref:hypothetical protein n=1 Tax=Pyrococcus kukulkanii TaxID=1609559 RepID=UPI0035684820